jgi:hypothetical protein
MILNCLKNWEVYPLVEQIIEGNLLPYQFGAFNDFLARWGKRRYRSTYYDVWHKDPNRANETAILNRRYAIGLNTLKQQNLIENLTDIRRRDKIMNSTIIMD